MASQCTLDRRRGAAEAWQQIAATPPSRSTTRRGSKRRISWRKSRRDARRESVKSAGPLPCWSAGELMILDQPRSMGADKCYTASTIA
jgi:hypothetical protein